jgi:hypothetical protein
MSDTYWAIRRREIAARDAVTAPKPKTKTETKSKAKAKTKKAAPAKEPIEVEPPYYETVIGDET